jgi:L-fucose isomerase-like protein
MRKVKPLVLPFFCEGYDRDAAAEQVDAAVQILQQLDMEPSVADMICCVADAEAAAKAYNPYNYDFAVIYTTTWSEPRLACVAARQFFGMPLVIWCQDEFMYQGRRIEMSAAPASAALRGCLQEMGVPCEMIVGLPLSQKNLAKLTAIGNAARTISLLRNTKLGFFGHNFNGITAADFDLSVLRRRMGTEVYAFDCSELIIRMEAVDPASDAYKAMEKRVADRLVGNTGRHFERIVRMCVALEGYIAEYDLAGLDMRCHTELSQSFGLAACLPLSVLGDMLPCSCEADIPVMMSQMLLYYLSGGKVSAYVDLRTFHEEGMDVGACGYAPCSLTGGKATVSGPEAPGNGNPEGYLTNKSGFQEGRLTMARLLKFPGGVLKLHITGAEATPMESPLQEMGCPYYPMAKVVPDVPMAQFTQYLGANHYALIYDDVAAAAKVFCKYTNIQTVI